MATQASIRSRNAAFAATLLRAARSYLTNRTAFVIAAVAVISPTWAAEGNPSRGERVFGACAACHSLEPDQSMTGPSLANLWERKAGSVSSFPRYSAALKSSSVVWNDKSLDDWIKDPAHFIPGNQMIFNGIKNDQQRTDLVSFLRQATVPGSASSQTVRQNRMAASVPHLKKLDPEERVQKINHCGDTYKIITVDGKSRDFWERNLRFKTDVSDEGPEKGAPALVPAGMVGDRADVIFASPEEISGFISNGC